MICKSKTGSIILSFLVIFLFVGNVGNAASISIKQLGALKATTVEDYSILVTETSQATGIHSSMPTYNVNLFVKESVSRITEDIAIVANYLDENGDDQMNCDEEDNFCPTLATTDPKVIKICPGETVSFLVMTDAASIPFHEINILNRNQPNIRLKAADLVKCQFF